MKARVVYQGLLFFNSTLLYSLAMRMTGSRELLFFSAFIAALSLTANLAVQLSPKQFRSAIWILKLASISLLTWVCLNTGISPSVISLIIGVLTIILTHRDALVGSPSKVAMVLVLIPIGITSLLIGLAYMQLLSIFGEEVLLLLILPYLLTALANRPKITKEIKETIPSGRFHATTLTFSQLIPTASSFVMLSLVSFETNAYALTKFVTMERAVAIGGSLIYFIARVKGDLVQLASSVIFVFLIVLTIIAISSSQDVLIWIAFTGYLLAGVLLSYGTISLGRLYPFGILAINGVALLCLLLVPSNMVGIQPVQIIAVYICPQLLLMGALLAFNKYQNA
jgi:hypothetical protein